MGERDQGGAGIQADLGQRFVGPLPNDWRVAEALFRGKGRARVQDYHLVAKRAGHGDKLLGDMHGADDDEPRRRIEHVDEELSVRPRQLHALVAAERLVQRRRQVLTQIA